MTLQKQARYFIAALSITFIFIAMVLGFMLVDLASERYMPGMLDPIYKVGELGEEGIAFYWMGQPYRIYSAQMMERVGALWELRGLLPPSVRLAGGLAATIQQLI
ncbi:MAG: hypothetical protein FWE19_09610 [Oscillospiraceae bacterium]|nr:hypothetical protein [Oscillospiraceae bacterium]